MTTRTVWRVCYGGVWAFGIASTLYAGERVHRTVVIDGRSFPAEIVILVDASGSMSERSRYPLAVTEALAVAEQASDAGRVKFGIFGAALTWEPRGWIKMPDADALKAARAWLAGWVPSGNTDIIGAVEEALRETPIDLGVIVVTDLAPDGGAESNLTPLVERARQRGAVLGIVGIEPAEAGADDLGRDLARETGGAYLRVRRR
ncbi:MAG TPA: vWA domain-containing protein [Gemmatimonadaceae bacterium]